MSESNKDSSKQAGSSPRRRRIAEGDPPTNDSSTAPQARESRNQRRRRRARERRKAAKASNTLGAAGPAAALETNESEATEGEERRKPNRKRSARTKKAKGGEKKPQSPGKKAVDAADAIVGSMKQLSLNDDKKDSKEEKKGGEEEKQGRSSRRRKKMTKKEREELRERQQKLREAAVANVNSFFGVKTHLQILQDMCRNLLGESTLPGSVREALRLLEDVHVNIFDYTELNGVLPPHLIFTNIDDLIERCEALRGGGHAGYYPVALAKSQGMKDLLRSLFYGRRRRRA